MVDAHPDADTGAPPVAICCAASDEATVRETAEALSARGHQVHVAVGVDTDSEILARAIGAQQGRGLFVLCRSHALDRNAVDSLREILRAHDVPFGRTLTLAVDTQRPREVEERIVSVLRRMVTGRADGRPRTWGSAVPLQDEDPDTTIRRPGGAAGGSDPAAVLVGLGTEPEHADPYASTSQIEMVDGGGEAPAVPYTGAEHTAVGPSPLPPTPSSAMPPLPAPAATPSPSPVMHASPMPPSPRPAVPPSPVPGPTPVLLPSAVDSGPSLGFEASESASMSDAMAGYTPAPVSAAADESSTDFEPPLTVGGRMGRALGSPAGLAVVLGGLAVVVVVALAVSLLGGDDEDDGTVASAPATAAAKDDAKPKADDAEATKPDATKTDAKPEPESAGVSEPGEDDDEPPPAAAADPGEPSIPARTFDPDDDPPEVVAALRDREVRALDVFLVAPERKGSLSYEQAVTYCRELEIAGLTGWRVPAIGELNSVAGAKMLGKSVYWSSTPGDSFGDELLVINGKKKSISVVSKGWDGAKIVCIRPRQA